MKTRTLFTILTLVLAVLIITGSCATTPKPKEEREAIEPEVFFQSVRSGDYAEVQMLIKEGADVNARTKEEVPALMIASQYGYIEVAKSLIDVGADVNAQDKEGWTALEYASKGGHTEIVKLLIEAGAKE
jgi:ankyrin repeat protein